MTAKVASAGWRANHK